MKLLLQPELRRKRQRLDWDIGFLYQRGVSLPNIGWIVGVYGLVWGGSQLFTAEAATLKT